MNDEKFVHMTLDTNMKVIPGTTYKVDSLGGEPLMTAAQQLAKAWLDPGSHPDAHRAAQDKLRLQWPHLHCGGAHGEGDHASRRGKRSVVSAKAIVVGVAWVRHVACGLRRDQLAAGVG